MCDNNKRMPLWEYLGWVLLIAGLSYTFVIWGTRSTLYGNSAFKIVILLVDTLIGTFSPMHAVYIVLRRHRKISGPKPFLKRVLATASPVRAAAITMLFCLPLLLVTMLTGTRTESPWMLFILAVPVMIIAGGVEEVGWRGFLQPALEERLSFIAATLATAGFWMVWHLPLWLIEASSQAKFSFGPYMLNLIADSFILASIYFLTRSVVPCMIYHAWGNALGVAYDWSLFASYPISPGLWIYYAVMIAAALFIRTASKQARFRSTV